MTTPSNIILFLTAIATALIAGLFYSWACSVTVGLGRLSDSAYLGAMQAINDAILNPVFFASFLGTAILLPITTYMHYSQPASIRFWFLLAATVVYLLGVFGVTVAGNVPLNDALKNFDLHTATAQQIAAHRARFEGTWNSLNTMRTVASVIAIALVILACLNPKNT